MPNLTADIHVDVANFQQQLREYLKYSSRSLTVLINQSAFNIVTVALRMTKTADRAKIESEIGANGKEVYGYKVRILKGGKVKIGKAMTRKTYVSNEKGAPLLALYINKKRGESGLKGLRGEEMRREVDKEWARRRSGIGFLRAGWLPAINTLAKAIGKAGRNTKSPLGDMSDYGGAAPARNSMNPEAFFFNGAFDKMRNTTEKGHETAVNYSTEALSASINQEINRLKKRITDKLAGDNNKILKKIL